MRIPARGRKGGNDGRSDALFSEVLPLFRMRVGVECKRMTNLPAGWQHGTLQDVVAGITTGVSVNGEDRPRGPGEVGVLKISCVLRGRFDPTHYKTVISADRARVAAPVTGGTILVSRANTAELVGASAYVPQSVSDLFLPDKLWQLKPGKNVDVRWLSHVVADPAFRPKLASAATGTSASMKNISQEAFLALPVAIPPLPEQRRIAAILGTWDAAIEKAERLVDANAHRLTACRQRLIFQMNYPRRELAEFADLVPDLVDPRTQDLRGIPCVELQHLDSANGIILGHAHASSDSSTRRVFHKGDILFGKLRPYLKKYALPDFNGICSSEIWVLRPKKSLCDPGYLFEIIQSSQFIAAANKATGSRMPRADWNVVSEEPFPLPDLSTQRVIRKVLRDVAAYSNRMRDFASRIKVQKHGLMQKLLTGKIRVPEAVADLSPAAD
ncbi:restriction endonuclease subunit S [Acidibrevibacterium fodinaquatile]|uniref:restriction endonuclease subunit S n=1 Tax=Acidibrevibacterium fodinaquatile TaxID=1969806 RepID=UPI0013B3A6A6|nr:restriction endonuclease subunit S [Acidibrevibacterium fodinaquatile]